jgi:formylglycine-generating enzyme
MPSAARTFWAAMSFGGAWLALGGAEGPAPAHADEPGCPSEMVMVAHVCVDRYEAHFVDKASGQALSPFYPPEPRLLQVAYDYWSVAAARTGPAGARSVPLPPIPRVEWGAFEPKAVSRKGVLPQGYLSWPVAKRACENAGKRLCSEQEWVRACRSGQSTKHPYGDHFEAGRCNVFRNIHPAYELHGNSSLGHLDPRLHLVSEEGKSPLLLPTGSLPGCVSVHHGEAIHDMVGNLDEWIADEEGTFVGGFYSRATREGCAAKIDNHAPIYTDYSLGVRCCKDAL